MRIGSSGDLIDGIDNVHKLAELSKPQKLIAPGRAPPSPLWPGLEEVGMEKVWQGNMIQSWL